MQPEKFIVTNNSQNIIVIRDLGAKIPKGASVDLLKFPKVTWEKVRESQDLSRLLTLEQDQNFSAIIPDRRVGPRVASHSGFREQPPPEVNYHNPDLLSLLIVFPPGQLENLPYKELPNTVQCQIMKNMSLEQRKEAVLAKINNILEKFTEYADLELQGEIRSFVDGPIEDPYDMIEL